VGARAAAALQGPLVPFCGIAALERKIAEQEIELKKLRRWASSTATSGNGWRL
jgi:hypothetical protein